MKGPLRYLVLGGVIGALSIAAAACGSSSNPQVQEFTLTGVELKGTTSAESLAPPSVNPEALSAGYRFKPVGFDGSNPSNWQVASYIWTPGVMTVSEGDSVELKTFIINGNDHRVRILDPNGRQLQTVDMNRGREYILSFKADEVGVYKIVCDTHAPTMTANVIVLPKV